MSLLKESERICRNSGNKEDLQVSLSNQAAILVKLEKYDEAMSLLKESERMCRDRSDKIRLSRSLGNQAMILTYWGRYFEAMQLHKEEEMIFMELENKRGLSISLGDQAVIFTKLGKLGEAMRLYKEKEAICRELGNPEGLAYSLINQATILSENMCKSNESLPLVEEAYRLATEHGLAALAQQIKPLVDALNNPSRISKSNKEDKKPPELSPDGKLICPVCTQKSQQGATFCIWCKARFKFD